MTQADVYRRYEEEVSKLLEKTPFYADLLNRRGVLRLVAGEHAAAREDLLAALSRNPAYEEARVNLAFAVAFDDPEGAVQLAAQLAKSSEKSGERYLAMACLCISIHSFDQAWHALHHAMRVEPKNPVPHHWAGYLAFQQGNVQDARSHLLRSATLPGGCAEGYEALGVRRGDSPDVEALMQQMPHDNPTPGRVTLHREVSRWLATQGEHQAAKTELAKMLTLDPTFAPYACARGRMELLWGNSRRAERWLRRALESHPSYGPAHESLAQTYRAVGDPVREERHLLAASEIHPNYPDLRYDLALLCLRSERFEEAVSLLQSCLAIHPKFAMARFRLGECYSRLGQEDCAREQFLQLPDDVRQDPEVRPIVTACLTQAPTTA